MGARATIVHVESPSDGQQGDSRYRTRQPCDALGAAGYAVLSGHLGNPAIWIQAESADVLVLCDVADVDLLPLVQRRRARGLVTVYEINDDFRSPQPWSRTAYLARNLLSRALSAQLAASSDGVQFSTEELARRYAGLHAQRRVFPNQREAPPLPLTPRRGPVVVGWGGSLGHLEDVKAMLPALRRVLEARPDVSLQLMGPGPFAAVASALPRTEYVPGGSLEDYEEFVRKLTVGLAPNLPTAFNRCRSDVKFLEYAALGAVAVCQDLEPYRGSVRQGENGLLFGGEAALERALLQLADEPALRTRLAGRAWADVQGRVEAAHVNRRITWIEALRKADTPVLAHAAPPEPGHRREADPVGAIVLEGLTALAADDGPRAAACFREAVRRAPSFDWAQVLLARAVGGRAGETALEPALHGRVPSVAALLLKAELVEARGAMAEAAGWWRAVAKACPSLGFGQFKLGLLAEALGDKERAEAWLVAAQQQNPYFMGTWARRALKAGDVEATLDWVSRGLEYDPEAWVLHFTRGEALLTQGQPGLALRSFERALEGGGEPKAITAALARCHAALGRTERAEELLRSLAA